MKNDEKYVYVRIVTTAGDCPEAPKFEEIPADQPVQVFLKQCSEELKLVDTSGWLLSGTDGKIDEKITWSSLGLTGKQILEWGPDAGGGGIA